jgi:hypothetical protein
MPGPSEEVRGKTDIKEAREPRCYQEIQEVLGPIVL